MNSIELAIMSLVRVQQFLDRGRLRVVNDLEVVRGRPNHDGILRKTMGMIRLPNKHAEFGLRLEQLHPR